MSREAAEVFDVATDSTQMRGLPFGCGQLWSSIAKAMLKDRVVTLTQHGGAVSAAWLARVLSCTEEDIARCLDPLLEAQLLVREEGGGLTCPLLVQQAERRRLAVERRQLAAIRRAEFEQARAAGTIDPNLTPRQYSSRVNGSKSPGRTPIYTPGQRSLSMPQMVGGTAHQVPSHNPRGLSGYRDQVPDLVPDQVRDLGPGESRDSRGLTDCSSQGIENSQSVSPEGRARDRVPDQNPGPTEVPDQEVGRIGRRLQQILGLHGGWGGNSNRPIRHWLSLFPETELFEIAIAAKSRTTEPIRSMAWLTTVFEGEAQARAVVSQDVDVPSELVLTPEESEGWAACRKREDEQFQERLRLPPELRGERPKLAKKADFVGWRRPNSARSA